MLHSSCCVCDTAHGTPRTRDTSPIPTAAADSIFRRLGGSRNVILADAPVSLIDCLFTQNLYEPAENGLPLALIHLQAGEPLPGGLGPGLRYEAVTSISNPHPFTVSAGNDAAAAQVFSDYPLAVVVYAQDPAGRPTAPGDDYIPAASQALGDLAYNIDGESRFISERTPAFIERQLVRLWPHACVRWMLCPV